jgi:hypothetical protein
VNWRENVVNVGPYNVKDIIKTYSYNMDTTEWIRSRGWHITLESNRKYAVRSSVGGFIIYLDKLEEILKT